MTNNFGNNSFGKLTGRKTVKTEIKKEETVIEKPKAAEEPEPFEIEVKSWVEDK
jgi:hypothetical protein